MLQLAESGNGLQTDDCWIGMIGPHSLIIRQTATSIEYIRLSNKMNKDEDLTNLIRDYLL